VGSSHTVYAHYVDAAGNASHGFFVGNQSPTLEDVSCARNDGGGFLCSSTYDGPFHVQALRCAFTANGCIACDVQSARGGAIEQCIVSGGMTGISVGSLTCPSCVSAVRVCDNTISLCGTGLQVLAGGHHLVMRNAVSDSLAAYSVGAGNLFGPVVSSADMETNTNPGSNFAP
jgi:hypothetical protein